MTDPTLVFWRSRDRILWWFFVGLTAVAVAVGLWLRLALRDAGSLWLHEAWTLDAVSRSFKEMIGARLLSDQSPPLFTILTWLWLRIAGTYDAGTMRLLSVGLGSLVILGPLAGALRMSSMRSTYLVIGRRRSVPEWLSPPAHSPEFQ